MIFKCFGTAGYHPSESRHTSCYYLPELGLLLDAGTGIFRLTRELIYNPKESIDIVLSHAHMDHVAGLTFLLDTMAVTSLKHIRVIGESEKLQAVRTHIYNPLIFPVEPQMEFIELDLHCTKTGFSSATFQVGQASYQLDSMLLDHPGGCLGFVIHANGKKFAYITDTTGTLESDYVKHLTDLDLLVHECNFDDDNRELAIKTGHCWQSAVVDIVEHCRPRKTLLVHHNPLADLLGRALKLDDRQRKLNIHLANDRDEIEI
jgi:ribonuclease Z